MSTVIRVENLSKQYRLGTVGTGAFAHDVNRWWYRVRGKEDPYLKIGEENDRTHKGASEYVWALRNVNFEVKDGEVLGIIGRNGAGKSTLLKILSRTTAPTTGRVKIKGRVASLLEVGTGFHPDLTGRENIFLNGAILGMTRREIARKFDEIVDFAGVERYIDTPVKRYSSGMYVRLAFAVAAHLDLEILIVDEVLAVGDYAFQRKGMRKMMEAGREGKTILFVSHNMNAVMQLCQRVLVIDNGNLAYSGQTYQGINKYLENELGLVNGEADLSSHPARRPGCTPLLKLIRMLDKEGIAKTRFGPGEAISIELTLEPSIFLADPQLGIGVDDAQRGRVFAVTNYLAGVRLPTLREEYKVVCHIRELPLAPGRYSLSLSVGTQDNLLMDALDFAVSFEVDQGNYFGENSKALQMMGAGIGSVLVHSSWEVAPSF